MARAKKEAALTPEERLQAALVPDWEWPYKLPENWCWVRLYSLAHIISKGTTPKGGKDAYVEKGIRFLRIENINEDGSISHENIKHITEEMHTGFLRRSILCKDDILISIAGTLGKTGIVGEADLPLNTNQAISFVRLIRGNLLPQYIKMSIDNPKTQDMLISQTKVTSIPNLTLEIIGNCAIPLAPLAEQQRIVDRIESLFAKLDEAKENAKRYPLCENRRIPFTRNPPVSCLLGRCPNPRRTKNFCSETMDKSIGCAILQIACGREAQRCSASFSRRSFASSCSLSSSRIRSILALAVSSSFISSRAFR